MDTFLQSILNNGCPHVRSVRTIIRIRHILYKNLWGVFNYYLSLADKGFFFFRQKSVEDDLLLNKMIILEILLCKLPAWMKSKINL